MSSDLLSIVVVSPEFYPLAKTGGLADVTSALSKSLCKLGHQVKVFIPLYRVAQKNGQIKNSGLKPVQIPVGEKSVEASLKVTTVSGHPTEVFLIDCPEYFDRQEIVRDHNTGLPYPDNDERFIVFTRATLEYLKMLGLKPDVIQCNDWQAALIPVYLKNIYSEDLFYQNIPSLLSINNLALQGIFSRSAFAKLRLPQDILPLFDFHNKISFLKAGILSADILSTVSENYAVEIQASAEIGYGLEEALRLRNNDLYGILNGADYDEWSPSTDKYIPHQYGETDFAAKRKNKQELLEQCGFAAQKLNWPALGVVTRMVEQKGMDLILDVAEELLHKEIVLIVLGKGDAKYQHAFRELEKKHSDRMKVFIAFDEKLAHLIEAGSDIYLMPSKFEPCGLNQLYSLKYGTVPIVRKTGGLTATVEDYKNGAGTGIVFEGYYSFEFMEAVDRALELYQNKPAWEKLQKEGMKQDFSWEKAAQKYVELYKLAKKS
jgi:starch synthase